MVKIKIVFRCNVLGFITSIGFVHRVMFDIVTQACVPDLVVPPQVFISCNFCGKSVTNTRGFRMPERNYLPPFSRAPQQQRVKVRFCILYLDTFCNLLIADVLL